MKKKIISCVMATALTVSAFAACSGSEGGGDETTVEVTTRQAAQTDASGNQSYSEDEVLEMRMFACMAGTEINDGNEIQELIAERTGVKVKETWLTGQTASEAIGSIIASGDLPDFIDGGDGCVQLYENGLLVAWDPYLEEYPNLKEMYSDAEWEMFRQDDGKIYWANVFNNTYGKSKATGHNDEAFWIQVRVLEEAGYPEVKTLDQYFDLIEAYVDNHPQMDNGTKTIGYTALCYDWYYYCIENPGEFLAGYPNDGSVIVNLDNPDDPTIEDYNTSEITKNYLKKLNEVYNAGYMDIDFATQTRDEYIQKLSSGCVLGMCDQNWNFAGDIAGPLHEQGLDELGCEYVPLGLMADGVTQQQWHVYGDTLNNSSGCAVTTSCEDPQAAFQFLSDILEQDIHDLRFWGIEGVDYLVDEDGLYYRTPEMRENWKDETYKANHCCFYAYMPQWGGTSRDGINAMQPGEQGSEYRAGLSTPMANLLVAYGANGLPDLIGSVEGVAQGPWYPMWSYSNEMGGRNDTAGCVAWGKMGDCKHIWIPQVVMSKDFDATWEEYMAAYAECNPQDFLDEMQTELDARIAMAEAAES
ncbi:MAG: sugar ABC transporter substrate-binding protein [Clostridia bacterium]|nr:sugar ABC transporter substrate-binding protein [Clostridia bacterium]